MNAENIKSPYNLESNAQFAKSIKPYVRDLQIVAPLFNFGRKILEVFTVFLTVIFILVGLDGGAGIKGIIVPVIVGSLTYLALSCLLKFLYVRKRNKVVNELVKYVKSKITQSHDGSYLVKDLNVAHYNLSAAITKISNCFGSNDAIKKVRDNMEVVYYSSNGEWRAYFDEMNIDFELEHMFSKLLAMDSKALKNFKG